MSSKAQSPPPAEAHKCSPRTIQTIHSMILSLSDSLAQYGTFADMAARVYARKESEASRINSEPMLMP